MVYLTENGSIAVGIVVVESAPAVSSKTSFAHRCWIVEKCFGMRNHLQSLSDFRR